MTLCFWIHLFAEIDIIKSYSIYSEINDTYLDSAIDICIQVADEVDWKIKLDSCVNKWLS